MVKINYVIGDATIPLGDGRKIIAHVCNDIGGWGRGFVMALSKRWIEPEKSYREWYRSGENFRLGEVMFVKVEDGLCVANMIAQHNVWSVDGIPPIRYDSLRLCLRKVYELSERAGATVHMPRIGCGLAGGNWDIVENIIMEELVDKGIQVTVYDRL